MERVISYLLDLYRKEKYFEIIAGPIFSDQQTISRFDLYVLTANNDFLLGGDDYIEIRNAFVPTFKATKDNAVYSDFIVIMTSNDLKESVEQVVRQFLNALEKEGYHSERDIMMFHRPMLEEGIPEILRFIISDIWYEIMFDYLVDQRYDMECGENEIPVRFMADNEIFEVKCTPRDK